jgi:hypothetical protein
MIATVHGRRVAAADLASIYRYVMARYEARQLVEQQTHAKLRRIVGISGVRIVRRRAS